MAKPKTAKPAAKPKAKAKAAPAPKTPAQPVQEHKALGNAISENDLKNLLRRVGSLKKQSDSVVGELREQIAMAVEKKHLHKGAFAQLRKLQNMATPKLVEYWDQLEHYMEISGEFARMEEQEKLPLGAAPEAEGDEGDGGEDDAPETQPTDDGKVSRPRFGEREGGGGAVAGLATAAGAKLA